MREDDNSPLRAWAIILTVVATLLIIYPLSVGPMYWLCGDASNAFVGVKGKAFIIVYGPVIRIYQDGPEPLHTMLVIYIRLWEKK